MAYKSNSTPQQDTGWGVIYRLNDLFREVEDLSTKGKYDEWNYKLDRIFSNLCYRNPLKIKRDEAKKIISIDFDEDSYKIKLYFDSQVLKHKNDMSKAIKKIPEGNEPKKNKEWIQAKKQLYKTLFMKEIWLRKFMTELGLYLKEVEYNPAGAMFNR